MLKEQREGGGGELYRYLLDYYGGGGGKGERKLTDKRVTWLNIQTGV